MTRTLRQGLWVCLAVVFFLNAARGASVAAPSMGRYNIVWESPSQDHTGQMPLGNGDIAAGVYAIENGDLFLLLSKNDAFTYNGDLFKTGRLRVSLDRALKLVVTTAVITQGSLHQIPFVSMI